ncbi:periplasmic repressor CpxP [Photobacterium aquae]|uniref:Periplasmic repressor CpxP n=1 Tax=Photobacterium aquae TaxID=1195763 RepID=A0A0J1H778_9GAMM|nr:CpxP family protein [Photobacterium aquae]KLV07539.1 periplasmic repressor CpxP [Photobacterium aquae]
MATLKKTLALVIALPLALGSASALAYGGGKHHGGHGGKGACGMHDGKQMFRQLDLSDEQKSQLQEMRKANREAMKSEWAKHHGEMRANHQQMQKLVLADNFDEAAVRSLAEKMTEQQVERRVEMLKHRHDMLNVLTADQKAKYQQLQAERMEKCEARIADKEK